MNTSRINPLRGCGKAALAGWLVALLFLSALASASPSLHHWLHKDHPAPSHYCLVTALEHGQTELAGGRVLLAGPLAGLCVTARPCESFFISHDLTLHPERGPPVLS